MDDASPRVAGQDRPRRPRRAGHAAGLPRRDRRADHPPRHAPDHDRRARARLAMGAEHRQVALPARDRHPFGRWAVRRDRRLHALPAPGAPDELPRLVPCEHSTGTSRRQGAITRPAAGTAADSWSKPPGTTAADHARATRSSAARPGSPRTSSRSPGPRSNACTTRGADSTASAASAARSSPSPSHASSPASAGPQPTPTKRACTMSLKGGGGTDLASTRESIRGSTMSSRHGGHARS